MRACLVLLAAVLAGPALAQPAPFSLGGPQEDVVVAVDVAPDGAFAIGGLTFGGYDADPGPGETLVPNGGQADGFAAVYGPDGALRFAVPIGPPGPSGPDDVFDVALGPDGELAVVGQVGATVDLDPGPGETIIEAPGFAVYVFVAVYEPGGALRYGFAVPGLDFGQRAYTAFDDDGNLYVAASVSSETDLDPGPGETLVDGFRSAALIAYTPAGALRWGFALEGAQYRARGIDVAGDRVALAGDLITGAVDVDPGPGVREIEGVAITDWLTATYTTDAGALATAFVVGGSAMGGVRDVALDDDGRVTLVGQIDRDADFDPGDGEAVVSNSEGSAGTGVVAAYNADATLRFAHGLGSTHPRGVDAASGRVVYTALLSEAFDADPGAGQSTVTPTEALDVVTVSLTSGGAFEWAAPIVGPATGDNGLDVALGGDRTYLTGRFAGTADVDPGPEAVALTSSGRFDYDAFLVAYDRNGALAARPTTGERPPSPEVALRVWPNPSAGAARVRLGAASGTARVAVVDALGREVAVLWDGPAQALDLPVPPLAPGVYSVRVRTGRGVTSARFVVAR